MRLVLAAGATDNMVLGLPRPIRLESGERKRTGRSPPASVSASLLGKDADVQRRATGQTESMPRRGPSVLFAALLLVAQLLFGVMSAAAAHHCGGCPDAESSAVVHDAGSAGADCGSHCSDDASTGHPPQHGCVSGCSMAGSSHCSGTTSPALHASTLLGFEVGTTSYQCDRGSVALPDSPLFDFLRPPTRG